MKVKFIGETDPVYMINGKVYDVISIEETWYRIVDEEGEDYLLSLIHISEPTRPY